MPTNENGRAYPAEYYFDDQSKDAVPESEMNSTEVKVDEPKVETVQDAEMSPSEVAQKRKEAVVNFFNHTKENFKNKVSLVGNGIKNLFGKAKAFGSKALDVAIAPDAYIAKGLENADNFLDKKADQLELFVKGRIDMVKIISEFVQYESVEKYVEVQNAVDARFESLKQYGVNAIESGADRIRSVKEGVRNKKNQIIIAYLKSIEESHRAKADNIASKISFLNSL